MENVFVYNCSKKRNLENLLHNLVQSDHSKHSAKHKHDFICKLYQHTSACLDSDRSAVASCKTVENVFSHREAETRPICLGRSVQTEVNIFRHFIHSHSPSVWFHYGSLPPFKLTNASVKQVMYPYSCPSFIFLSGWIDAKLWTWPEITEGSHSLDELL